MKEQAGHQATGSETGPGGAPRSAPESAPGSAIEELERELRARRSRKWRTLGLVVLVIVVLFGGLRAYRTATEPPPESLYSTADIERRTVKETVMATGSAKPVTEVQVGAQVSGRVEKIYVDFNSPVKEGQLLAEIDPSLFSAQVSQNQAAVGSAVANVASAQARLDTAELDLSRAKELRKRGVTSQAIVDTAQGAKDVAVASLKAARAQVKQARAHLNGAKTTLGYARIYSPVDGIVVNRAIEPGQTVASSFSAPVLFVIAKDLRKMQVLADIDEADVGKLKEGMMAEVEVDAFPGEPFNGVVSQVRYSPKEEQGVVTYSAVIDVANPDLKLRPGMTSNVTIQTAEAKDALAVRNAALRFQPPPKKDEEGEEKKQGELLAEKKRAEPGDEKEKRPALKTGQGRVYLIEGAPPDEELAPKVVNVGITDGIWTVVLDNALKDGTPLVTRQDRERKRRGFRFF